MYFGPNTAIADPALSFPHCPSGIDSAAGTEVPFDGQVKQPGAHREAVCKSEVLLQEGHISVGARTLTHADTQKSYENAPKPKSVWALRLGHTRTRSATASNAPAPFIISSSHRARAVSVSGSPTGVKASYTYSQTLPRGIVPRVQPVLSVATQAEETIGSFSPTSCPRRQLHNILDASSPPRRQRQSLTIVTRLRKLSDASSHDETPATSPSPPLSPIPSICRTPSSYSESEYFPTAPSSAGPATPVHSAVSSPLIQNKSLRPILEALEDASKFRVRTACAACGRQGSNYPCCPRCGEMWCSRVCRLQSNGGKRHVCGGR